MNKETVKQFLIEKKGYLKKSPLEVAKILWKNSSKYVLSKNKEQLKKEINEISKIQSDLRKAIQVQDTVYDNVLLDAYNQIIEEKNKPKRRIFFDLEVSANIVFSWRIGRKINLSAEDIIQERTVICVCWKFEDENKVHSLQWNKGNDKELLIKFAKIIDSADEVIGQNSDKFDIKWLRTRCAFYGIPLSPKFNSIDTLKMAKSGFNFNSNRLDYMGKFFNVGKKIKTEYDLWKDITLHNSKEAMTSMIEYCKEDVRLLQRVYDKLQPYCQIKKFKYKL